MNTLFSSYTLEIFVSFLSRTYLSLKKTGLLPLPRVLLRHKTTQDVLVTLRLVTSVHSLFFSPLPVRPVSVVTSSLVK